MYWSSLISSRDWSKKSLLFFITCVCVYVCMCVCVCVCDKMNGIGEKIGGEVDKRNETKKLKRKREERF